MNKEAYERLAMDVTKFDVEDVITTSGVGPGPGPGPEPGEGIAAWFGVFHDLKKRKENGIVYKRKGGVIR